MRAPGPALLLLVLSVVGPQTCLTTSSSFSSSSSSHSSQASLSTMDNKQRAEAVRGLEQGLLTMLGLTSRPRPHGDVPIPGYMMELYQQHLRGKGTVHPHYHTRVPNLPLPANTVRSFFHEGNKKRVRRRTNQAGRKVGKRSKKEGRTTHKVYLYFNVSSMPSDEELTGAELRISHQQLAGLPRRVHRLEVHEVVRRTQPPITRLLDARVVRPGNDSTWESFDVRPAVVTWRRNPERNMGLQVRVITRGRDALSHVRLRRSTRRSQKDWVAEQPFLVTYGDDGRRPKKSKRRKRSKQNRPKKRSRTLRARRKRRNECARHRLYVDFSEVGWEDWIVAPPGYQAYYCSGECAFPYPDYINTTNHAIVQSLVHSVHPDTVPRPCCVPTELSSISMLYLDEYNKLVLKTYQDMVVQRCGCL